MGLRFRPGVLPRLLGVPASELRNERVPLTRSAIGRRPHRSLVELAAALASDEPRPETAPWSLSLLRHVTGAWPAARPSPTSRARSAGRAARCSASARAVYGYGPATLRRILRFRRAVRLLDDGLPAAEVAARAGYADQPHLHREVRELAGVPLASLRQLASSANRSTQLPSGSATVA